MAEVTDSRQSKILSSKRDDRIGKLTILLDKSVRPLGSMEDPDDLAQVVDPIAFRPGRSDRDKGSVLGTNVKQYQYNRVVGPPGFEPGTNGL